MLQIVSLHIKASVRMQKSPTDVLERVAADHCAARAQVIFLSRRAPPIDRNDLMPNNQQVYTQNPFYEMYLELLPPRREREDFTF
jgi:hypothetical protein